MRRHTTLYCFLNAALTLTLTAAAPQFYYNHVVPPQRTSTNLVVLPGNPGGIQQYVASGVPLPVGGQYLLVQPGSNPVLYVTRAEGETEKPVEGGSEEGAGAGGGVIDNFVNFVFGFVPANPFPSLTGGGSSTTTTTPKPSEDKPVKVIEQQKPASLETLDEDVPTKVVPVVPSPGQRFVVIGQPQFFGNYDALRNQAVQQNLGTRGAVSTFLLNQKDAKDSVTVEARPHSVKAEDEDSEDTEGVNADPPGPSVAQTKPQAIAMAGPGGVAAAAPVGTSVVGPGGMAVAAPSATAIAGEMGGAPPSSPSALRAYLLEQQAKGKLPPTLRLTYNL